MPRMTICFQLLSNWSNSSTVTLFYKTPFSLQFYENYIFQFVRTLLFFKLIWLDYQKIYIWYIPYYTGTCIFLILPSKSDSWGIKKHITNSCFRLIPYKKLELRIVNITIHSLFFLSVRCLFTLWRAIFSIFPIRVECIGAHNTYLLF